MRGKKLCALLFFISACYSSMATHLRAGEIQIRRTDCSALTFEITLLIYINYASGVEVGGDDDYLNYGDGSSLLLPAIRDYEIIDPELEIGLVKYTTLHTYSSFGKYTISYNEANRNFGILNYTGAQRFHIESSILVEPGVCNASPILMVAPLDRACNGISFFHNPGAIDSDLDSLSFEVVVPKQNEAAFLSDYKFPHDALFYFQPGIANGNESRDGPPVFTIDTQGTLTWDAPGTIGEYVVAIKIIEWKFRTSDKTWYEAGFIIRDMQIIVEECENRKPALERVENICVVAGSFIDFTSRATDMDGDSILIEIFSEAFTISENPPSIMPVNGTVQSTQSPDIASVNLQWQTSCEDVRTQPYKFVIKVTDGPPSGPRLTRFYTIDIKIIAPEPQYEKVSINPISKHATLEWKDYPCESVKSFQVWRRISSFQYAQPACDTGIPGFLRYQLIAEIPGNRSNYTDTDLAFGSQYCYRIVALVGQKETTSRISLDTCFIPKPAEAPVIVNVSVEDTQTQSGKILIRWTSPFEIDRTQYPPPFSYSILRRNDSDPRSFFEKITSGTISDTVFTDTGMNTQENIYSYRIELYVLSLTHLPVDTSTEVSTVFAETQPMISAIELTWKANTPWSNYSESDPFHLIYRGESPMGPFNLIDSVNIHTEGFRFVDDGQYKGHTLTKDTYFYKVKTRGTYGNPAIGSPLQNYSQITSGHILDTIPPCKPVLHITKINCQEFACDGSDYYTKLEWTRSEKDCDDDVVAYEIFVLNDNEETYTALGRVTGERFLHTNLNSLNKCYRLISIDQAGNQSDSSDVVCNSNCLNFKLPNIITPESQDENNDFLTTFPDDGNSKTDCPRSVLQVDLKIFTRWGTEIFTRTINPQNSTVFWNGRNLAGNDVSTGTYYYQAVIIFDTNDASQRTQEMKGWVHVLR